MKKLITYASAPQQEVLELVKPHYQAWADANDYQLHALTECDVGERKPHWAKVMLLCEHLAGSEACLWIDCDFVIRTFDDVMPDLQDDDFQGLVMEQTPHHGIGPNTGLWLLRNSREAKDFLDLVWKTGPLPDARLNDQATIAHLLGFSYLPDYTRPLNFSPWLAGTSWLPPRWNMLEIFHPEATLIAKGLHYGGSKTDKKLWLIRRQLVQDKLAGWQQARQALKGEAGVP